MVKTQQDYLLQQVKVKIESSIGIMKLAVTSKFHHEVRIKGKSNKFIESKYHVITSIIVPRKSNTAGVFATAESV